MERMAEKLLKFDAFGLIKITSYEATVNIIAITMQGKAIERVVVQEFEEPLKGFKEGEFLTATFGVGMKPEGKIRLAFNDMIVSENLPRVGEMPQATKAIAKAVKMVRQAIE